MTQEAKIVLKVARNLRREFAARFDEKMPIREAIEHAADALREHHQG